MDKTPSSAHADLYKRLSLLNQHCAAVRTIVKALGAESIISRSDTAYYALMLEEVRASCSQCVLEHLDEMEVRRAGSASQKRLTLENKLFDA